MKFVNKIIKSKYFGPIVSVILVLLAMYVLYRLFNNATEGMDQSLMKSDDKLRRVVGKILLLGPQKLGQFATSMPQEIQDIMKEEGTSFQELAETLQSDILLDHMNHHRSMKELSIRIESEKIAKENLINDIKQNGSKKYYDSGELIFYDKVNNSVVPNYDNTNWITRFNSVYDKKKSKFDNSKRTKKYNDIVDSYVNDKSIEMERGRDSRTMEIQKEAAAAATAAAAQLATTRPVLRPSTRPPMRPPTTVPTIQPSFMRR
jgi:hypothetical protein